MNIRHSMSQYQVQRQLQKMQEQVLQSYKELSSGNRINGAADDAAGLQVSERLTRNIRGDRMAAANVGKAVDLLRSGEAAMGSIASILQRMNELAVAMANGTYQGKDRAGAQQEFVSLRNEIERISTTSYNGISILDKTRIASAPVDGVTPPSGGSGGGNILAVPPVTSAGRLRFRTNEGYSTTELDNNMRLLFEGDNRTGLLINGNFYTLGFENPVQFTYREGDNYVTPYNIEGVVIKQMVRVVGEKYDVRYELENQSGDARSVGVLMAFDTQIGSDDKHPSIINGVVHSPRDPELLFRGSNIPNTIQFYNATVNPEVMAEAIFKGPGILTPPDQVNLGGYNNVDKWYYAASYGLTTYEKDIGYGVRWDERPLAPGATFTVNTLYGLTLPPGVPQPPELGGDGEIIVHHGSGSGHRDGIAVTDMRTASLGLDGLSVDSQAGSEAAFAGIASALDIVSSERGRFGSMINRFERKGDTLQSGGIQNEQTRQRITEADMAGSVSALASQQLKMNGAMSMLQKSGEQWKAVLTLLQN